MNSRREITERFGDPASFAYYGQYYHSVTPAECALCGRGIRNVYTLRTTQGRSVRTGECCFTVFKKLNAGVYTRLLAAQLLLDATDEGVKIDTKTYNTKGDLSYLQREWRKLKRQALALIRDYSKNPGTDDWLPRELYYLQTEALKKPGKTSRWFNQHIPILRNRLTVKIPSL
jgi:hypothetical protein